MPETDLEKAKPKLRPKLKLKPIKVHQKSIWKSPCVTVPLCILVACATAVGIVLLVGEFN